MKIEMDHVHKLTTVWLANGEGEDPQIKEQIRRLTADCKAKKHMMAVYHSGSKNLTDQTSGLLCYNRRRMVQLEGREM